MDIIQDINPNATERPPGFPLQFVSAPVPTAVALYNQIPPAVQFNLHRVITEGIRHEKNSYGYFNSAFVSIFSPTQRFQINPQYPARLAVEVELGGHGRNISVGSTGEIHAGRGSGREHVTFPDFTLTKPVPREHPTPRIHCNIAVFEIKTQSNPEEQDIEKGNLSVGDAMAQAIGYAHRLTTAFSIPDQNSQYIAAYLVYGRYYTKITMTDQLLYEAEPWQFVFEEFSVAALAEGRAPLLYRLCELAVRHWNYNG